MGEPELIARLVDLANATGEDFNDGDEFPGWFCAEWISSDVLEITYTNPEAPEPVVQLYRVERVDR